MPRTSISPQALTKAGLDATLTPVLATNGLKFDNSTAKMLIVKNTTAGALTMTPVITKALDGYTPTVTPISIGASKTLYFRPYPADYNQLGPTDKNYVYIDVSADGLSFGLIDL